MDEFKGSGLKSQTYAEDAVYEEFSCSRGDFDEVPSVVSKFLFHLEAHIKQLKTSLQAHTPMPQSTTVGDLKAELTEFIGDV